MKQSCALMLLGVCVAASSGRGFHEVLPGRSPAAVRVAPGDAHRGLVRHLPMRFEANAGQASPGVDFVSAGEGYYLALKPTEAVLRLTASRRDASTPAPASITMRLVGASRTARPSGEQRLWTRTHYYTGDDPRRWQTDIPNFARVRYDGVYPGIDLVYYGNQDNLEYDFLVSPGADPGAVALEFTGAGHAALDAAGRIVLSNESGELSLEAPVIYQDVDGERRRIPGGYSLSGNAVRFAIGPYDSTRTLVIDPVLTYATFFGSPIDDFAHDIALGPDGSFYVTGTQDDGFDSWIQVARFRSDGAFPLYTANIGRADAPGESSEDIGKAITVDSLGNAYVTGRAGDDVPVLSPMSRLGSAVVLKLNPDGQLAYSVLLGGSANDIAVDLQGQAHITGYTNGGLPVENAFQPALNDHPEDCVAAAPLSGSAVLPLNLASSLCFDAFVTKLNPDGSALVYSTYLGGGDDDGGAGIVVDSSGQAWVTGVTVSSVTAQPRCDFGGITARTDYTGSNFPVVNPIQAWLGGLPLDDLCALDPVPGGFARRFFDPDAFLTRFSPAGELEFSTYLGDTGYEEAVGIALDGAGGAHIAGRTLAAGFAAKVLAGTTSLAYLRELTRSDGLTFHPIDLAADASGSAWIAGHTGNFLPNVTNDAFVARLAPDGSRELFNSRFGASGAVVRATGITVDPVEEIAYVAGFTTSEFLPISIDMNPYQLFSQGGTDGFIFKLDGHQPEITMGPAALPAVIPSEGSTHLSVDASDSKAHELTFRWSNSAVTGGGTKCYLDNAAGFDDAASENPVWNAPANFSGAPLPCALRVVVTDSAGVQAVGSVTVTVEPAPNRPPVANVAGTPETVEQESPDGATVTLDGSLSSDPDGHVLSHRWTGPFGTVHGVTPEVLLPPGASTVTLVVNDGFGDSAPASLVVTVVDTTLPTLTADVQPAPNAFGWNNTDVTITFTCTDLAGDPPSPDPGIVTTEGADQSRTGTCTDLAGNAASVTAGGINIDKTPPTAAPVPGRAPDANGWYNHAFEVAWSATDALSGVASCAAPALYAGPDTMAGSLTGTCDDRAGNTGRAAFAFRFDATPPAIAIVAPAQEASYLLNEAVTASYECADAASGVAGCAGSVPAGGPLDTGAAGAREFSVEAEDAAGNRSVRSVPYTVGYGICLLYDPVRAARAGSTMPIRVQLCDASGSNVSSEDVVLTATGVTKLSTQASRDVVDAGNANPDDNFRFDSGLGGSGGYIFNLRTTGLTTGTYALAISVSGDPTPHVSEVTFQVR